jgi:hypothetical protein
VAGYLKGEEVHPASTHLVEKAKGHFTALSPAQKKEIDDWIQRISTVAMKRPHRSLEALIIRKTEGERVVREISATFVQLSAFIMRNYFTKNQVDFEFDELYAFMQTVYVEMIKKLEELAAGQKKLA